MRLLLLALLAGCGFSPTVPSGAVQCGTGGDCPGHLVCCAELGDVCVAAGECGSQDLGTDGSGDGGCTDDDGDGVCNPDDNCRTVANPGQGDCDADGMGDACDPVHQADCYGLRATLSAAGGPANSTTHGVVGVMGEASHSISVGPGYRLRGGLLPRAPRAP